MSAPRVGVVGASARAAVHSLARAGISAWAVDLFVDRDLKRVAPCAVCPLDSYPDAIPRLAAQFPPGPVLYTGGLENHPQVIAELAATRELWGNPPAVLERVRDPWHWSLVLAEQDFIFPALVFHESACPRDRRYLRKPLRSSAGHGIRFANPGEAASTAHYFQEFIDGPSMSAVFLDRSLFGITEQLVGTRWLHAKPFSYCGNIGPFASNGESSDVIAKLGSVLAMVFGLRGVWNADFILKDGVPVVVELNPRYTASVEVLEHARRVGVFQDASTTPPPAGDGQKLAPPSLLGKGVGGLGHSVVGKAIYYAPHRIAFPASGPWDADLAGEFDQWRLPGFADIPEPSTVIEPGWPVLTVFASGSSPAECRERLQSRAAGLDQLFAEHTP